ncbi:MAG: glycosyltransferase family 4 protein [Bacteroidetes bacterium]|nr:glycosyltransferase family 4 protein [Bacteroidota bacterium]MCL5738946.1 glycosyltransferase family 4 protein [Bacteroidota bacterium]
MGNKVLVIAYYFPPMGLSGVQRTLKFVKYLPDYGWEPTVLTITPTAYFALDYSMLREVTENNIKTVRTNSLDPTRLFDSGKPLKMPHEKLRNFLSGISQAIFVPDNKIGWRHEAIKAGRKLFQGEQFDVIFSTVPPYTCHLIGIALSKEFGVPLVLDYRDAWVDNPLHFYLTPFHKMLHQNLEKKVLRASNRIITINRRIKELMLSRYRFLGYNDIAIIPQGYDPEDFHVENTLKLPFSDRMRFTYAGTFYRNRTPKYFLRALSELIKGQPKLKNRIEAVFIGTFRKENLALIDSLGLHDVVKVFGYLDHKSTVRYLITSDVLWLTVGSGKGEDMISTGKLFEYIGSRKPIMGLVPDGIAKNTILESGAGRVVNPDDVSGIKKALAEYYELWEKNQLPEIPISFAQNYDRSKLTGELARELAFQLDYKGSYAKVGDEN